MKIEAKAGIKNRFDVRIQHIDTSNPFRNFINRLIVKTNKAFGINIPRWYKFTKTVMCKGENIVLNACFTRLVNFQTYFTHIHFGTGTGTLAPTRTSLFTFLSQKAANTVETVRALPTSRWVRNIVINPEEHVGQTLTEVGIAFGTASTNLCTHAMIEDAEGNPISLLKTDTMVVTIYATVYMTLGADASYSDKIRLVQPLTNNEWISYLMGATYPTQQFRVTRAPEFSNGTAPGSHGQSANVTTADWIKDAANKKVTTPVRRLGVSVGNGEVRGFGLGSSNTLGTFRGQFPITGVFTGKAITGESLGAGDGSKVGFNLAWNDPQSLVIKKDGVAVGSGDYDVVPVRKGTNVALFMDVALKSGSMPGGVAILTDDDISTNSTYTSDFVFQVDAGKEVLIDIFRVYMTNIGGSTAGSYHIRGSNSADFATSVLLGTLSSAKVTGWNEVSFPPVAPFRYYQISVGLYASSSRRWSQIQLLSSSDQITFHTPPPAGSVITADYTVDYVPKDSNHVLDLQCAIQYGEIT